MVPKLRIVPLMAGIAGEYFVAAELSRRGYVASLTLRNTRGIDILASNKEATKSVGIQVKTTRKKTQEWLLTQKAENEIATNLFYVFVRLNTLESPDYHIVPRSVVSKYVSDSHKLWLKTPGRKGKEHKDSTMRKFRDTEDKYLNRWDILGLD